MSWFRLEVDWFNNPKVLSLRDSAKLLYLAGLAYATRHMTDGFIPKQALPTFVEFIGSPRPGAHVNSLLSAGLWEQVEGGWQIHDYLKHQASKAQREAAQDSWRARQQRHRAKKGHAVTSEDGHAARHAARHGVSHALRDREESSSSSSVFSSAPLTPAKGDDEEQQGAALPADPWMTDGLPLGEERDGETAEQRWRRLLAWRDARGTAGAWFGPTPKPPASVTVDEIAATIGWSGRRGDLAEVFDWACTVMDRDEAELALRRCKGAGTVDYLRTAVSRAAAAVNA